MELLMPRNRIHIKIEPELQEFLDHHFIPSTGFENRSDVFNALVLRLQETYKEIQQIPDEETRQKTIYKMLK